MPSSGGSWGSMRSVVAALALLVAGCVTPGADPSAALPSTAGPTESALSQPVSPTPGTSPTTAPPSTPPSPAAPTPPAVGLTYSCGAGPVFDASAFAGPTGAELADDPAAAVIRAIPPTEDWQGLEPPWRLAVRTDDDALFLSGEERGWYALVSRIGGEWKLAGWGDCNAWLVPGDGDLPVTWWVDPRHAELSPAAMEIRALAVTPCLAGPLDGRLRPPRVLYRADEIIIAMSAVPPEPTADHCEGTTPVATVIPLEEPLGERVPRDAYQWPPRDARIPPE